MAPFTIFPLDPADIADLAGRPERTITNAGNRVVQSAADVRREQAALDLLLDHVEQLAIALEGPGPHMTRLQTLITSLARRPVVRAGADLLDAYIVLIREVNTLHADVKFETAVDLYDRALTTIARLFGPMSARLEEIDPLIAILEPTPEDVVRLAGFAGDARTLSYFFSRVNGVGWLRALASHQLMKPPVQGPWFAYGYLTKLAQSDPMAVGEWLRSQPRGQELHDHQAFLLIAIARDLGAPIADAVLHVAAGRTDDSRVLHQIVTYLSILPEEAHADTAVIGLTKRALDGVSGRRAPADDTYLATGLLNIVVSGSRQGEAGRWLRILVAKMAAAYDHFNKTEVRTLERVDSLALKPEAPVLDQFVAAIRDVARIAADQGMPTTERIARLRRIPLPLGSRLIAAHLLETVDSDIAAALTVLTEEVAHRGPMPETLALLSELTSLHPPGLEEDMLRALGDPPGSDEIAALDDAADFPKAWTHAYGWLISMPTCVSDAWTAANARVESRWGRASANGLLWPKPTVTAVRSTRVLENDESAPLEPLQAAARIAEWSPETEFGGATRYDTARELQDLVSKAPLRWVSQPQVAIVEALRDPIYVALYFRALAEHGRDILDAIALADGKVTSDHTGLDARSRRGVRIRKRNHRRRCRTVAAARDPRRSARR